MEIRISHHELPATSMDVPDFPLVRYDTGMGVYQEALIDGQYLLAHASAMGRPKLREWIWKDLHGEPPAARPIRTRQHAFHIEIDGQLLADHWEWVAAHEEVPDRPATRHIKVVLRHTQRPVEVEVHTLLDDTSFIVRWLRITNTGDRPAAVSSVFPWSGQVWAPVAGSWDTTEISGPFFTVGRFTDSTAGTEGAFDWLPIPDGRSGFESLNGHSGWGAPWCVLRNEVTGEACLVHFAWSGNWEIDLFNDHEPGRRPVCDARLYARVGLAGPAPLRVLAPGESTDTPAVHLGHLFGDLDRWVQELHTHARRSVVLPQPVGKEHRVEINHTGYTRNLQITESQLYAEIDVAADVGIELFMLDAGWFGRAADSWFEAAGDWDEESSLLPHGVQAAFERARERGMLCGLWVEAERMGATSRLLQEHPDWQMERRGTKVPNLDLSRPEIAEYFEQTIAGLIEKYRLDCFRLDYNISIGEGGDAERYGYTENVLWRYYEALYRAFDRIHQRFPDVLLENCSSGGGRTDFGIMSRFHWTQITDLWSPAPTLKIVNGMTLALPPELCETLGGAISDGVADLDFQLRVSLFGHFCASGIFPALDQQHVRARERWCHAIDLYKSFVRPILATSRLYHHTPIQRQREAGTWVVLECAGEDRSRAFVGVWRLAGARDDTYHFRARGLDRSLRYRVTFDTLGQSYEVAGDTLVDHGLYVRVDGALSSELILFEAVETIGSSAMLAPSEHRS